MEKEEKKELEGKTEDKDDLKEKTDIKTDDIERRCVKCDSLLKENNRFCTVCGADQSKTFLKKKQKKEKSKLKLKPAHIILITSFVTLIVCLLTSFGLYMYLNQRDGNINTSNKNVTIDDTGIADAVEKVYDSVVVIENYVNGRLYATGSGFVYDTDSRYGYILTNSHVVSDATSINVVFTNDKKAEAEVVGNDQYSDIAVLKVSKKYITQVAIMGDNDKMRIGDTTFAIGAPLDSDTYSWSVTRGILSGKDRVVSSSNSYMTVIQTDTPINSGNSGGPLCNANGEVIGITNMKLASDQIEGMGFAIPIETAIEYANQFTSGEDVRRPYIGVSIYDSNASFFSSKVQVVIESVEDDSPASKAGLKSGDVITKIDGDEVENSSYFKYKLYSYDIGDTVKITVDRNGKEKTFDVKLASNSEDA